jgi:hypothetical protein
LREHPAHLNVKDNKMTSILAEAEVVHHQAGFWRRQFAESRTQWQLVFDVVFGVAAPILCFYFDPIVFKGGDAVLQPLQLFVYGVAALEVSLFVLALIFGSRVGVWSRLIGGSLINGAVFSAVIGVAILPFSLMGLMVMLIGVLGFIPFVTAFIYLRVGWRAFQTGDPTPLGSWINAVFLGAILSIAIPALASFYVSRTASQSIEAIVHGDSQQAEFAIAQLRWLPFIPQQDLEPLVRAYVIEKDPGKKEMLRNSYKLVTGQDIDRRVAIIND